MKSERRHQLQTNSLASSLENAPAFLKQYGTHILLGIVAVLLLIALIRWRTAEGREQAAQAAASLDVARAFIEQLQNAPMSVSPEEPEKLLGVIQKIREDAEAQIIRTLEETDDPKLIAEGRILRGDLYWQLANMPALPGASTRPALKLDQSDDELLKAAADAYQNVLNDPASPPNSRLTARMSLAAVAENRRQWDEAAKQYQAVIDDADVPQPFKDQAKARLELLDRIKGDPLIGPPATAPADEENPEAEPEGSAIQGPPAPEKPAPETPAPETPAPETPAPETPAPETPAPETPAPETPARD